MDQGDNELRRVVIIGGGYAGAYCARALQRDAERLGLEVVLIDRNNYFVITPLLVEAGTGALEPRHAVVSLRAMAPRAQFHMGDVTGIDFGAKRVAVDAVGCDEPVGVGYDHLVIAVGSVTRLPDVPGLLEHGYEMKNLSDAVRLRDRAIHLLERANNVDDPAERRRLLHLVVVGAGYSGVETAGEMHVFMREAVRRYPRIGPDEPNVTLIEASDRILPTLDAELADYAAEVMRRRGQEIVLSDTVASVHADRVELASGRVVDTETLIWTAGIQPSPLLIGLDLRKDERGYLLAESDLSAAGRDGVWTIGDCAINPDPQGQAYPATAQHAVQMGLALARNIVRTLEGQPTRPFVYKSKGTLAALGCRTAVAKVGPFKLSGFIAWWLWRTVYLLKMPGLGRKVRVALDWTFDMLFSRDYVQLGIHRRSSGDHQPKG